MSGIRVDATSYHRDRGPGRRLPSPTTAGVWLVWLAFTAGAATLNGLYGPRLPWSDDWNFAPYVAGEISITWKWLWAQHNEHHIPLPKLISIAVFDVFGIDYRAIIFFNIAILSAVAAAYLEYARSARGHLSITDIFIPIILVNFGQSAFKWGFDIQFTLVTALILIFALPMLRHPTEPSAARTTISAVSLVLLPLCGGTGLLMAPGLGALLLYLVWSVQTPSGSRLIAALSVAATALLCALSIIDYQPIPHPWGYPTPRQTAVALLQFVSVGWGEGISRYPSKAVLINIFFVAACSLNLAAIVIDRRTDAAQRRRGLILLGCQASFAPLAIAVSYGRFNQIWAGIGHYSTAAMPLLIWCFLSQSLHGATPFEGQRRLLTMSAQAACAVVILIFGIGYLSEGRRLGPATLQASSAVRADLQNGTPTDIVVARHINALFFIDTEETRTLVSTGLIAFRNAKIPEYGIGQ